MKLLLDDDQTVVQGETQAGYFIVKDPPALPRLDEPTDLATTASEVAYTPEDTDADVILLVGNRTNQNGTDSWALYPPGATYIQIDEPSPAIHPEASDEFAALFNDAAAGVQGRVALAAA